MFGSRVTLSLVEEVMANLAPLALAQSRIGRVAPAAIKVCWVHRKKGYTFCFTPMCNVKFCHFSSCPPHCPIRPIIQHMNRAAWYWQQFLKLHAVAAGAGGLREHVRIMDGDSISVRSNAQNVPKRTILLPTEKFTSYDHICN